MSTIISRASHVISLGLARRILLLGLLAAAGCFDPLVGFPCAKGYSACGETCVDLTKSAAHCGACNAVCSGTCQASVCLGGNDGGGNDGGGNDAGGNDAPAADVPGGGDGSADAPVNPDGGRDGGDGGADSSDGGRDGLVTGDGPPSNDGETGAGDGASDAPGPNDVDAPTPGTDAPVSNPGADVAPGADVPAMEAAPPIMCTPGLMGCETRCVELATDPDNCGSCGNRCGSGLCSVGVCQQEGVGHVVVIGHDYVINRSGMNHLLGNAVNLSDVDPIGVLVYEGQASPAAIAGADAAINQVAAERGRRWVRTVGDSGDIIDDLQQFDVLLIYAQSGASDASLNGHGLLWAPSLATFLMRGKTVVLLDGPSPNNAGTFQILSTAGLFAATARADVTGQSLTLFNPGDAVALRVPRTYRAETSSVSFTTTEPAKVVTTLGGIPVVIHRTF